MHCCTLDFHSILSWYYARQGFTSPWRQAVVATRFFFTVVRDTCEFSVWTLFRAYLIVPRIVRWLIDFWKMFVLLIWSYEKF